MIEGWVVAAEVAEAVMVKIETVWSTFGEAFKASIKQGPSQFACNSFAKSFMGNGLNFHYYSCGMVVRPIKQL